MQPIPYDVRDLFIFRQDTKPRPNAKKGYAGREFIKSDRTYKVYLRPTADTMTKDSIGQIPNIRYRAIINQHIPIALGDRLGTDKAEFEIVSLLTLSHPTQHQMELKQL